MARKQKIITEEIYLKALEAIKEVPKGTLIHYRLTAIISGREHSISHVAKILKVTSQTLRSWVYKFDEGGVANLVNKPKTGRKSPMKDEHIDAIYRWIKADSQLTINAVLLKLKDEYALSTSKSSVHVVIKKLKFSYITPRPKHYKQNKDLFGDDNELKYAKLKSLVII